MKYQVIIIGGGPAGYTAAEAAGKGGLSVLLIEKNSLGGVCLNEGCIPTKTLLYSAKTYDSAKHASKYAVNIPEVSFDLPKIIARKSKVVRKLVLGVKAKLTANNVTIVSGEAQIIDKNTVRCGEETYEGENLILCTGSETFIPPIPGVDAVNYWTQRVHAGTFSHGIKTFDGRLSVQVDKDTSAEIMGGRGYRDIIFRDVDAQAKTFLVDIGEVFLCFFGIFVGNIQIYMVVSTVLHLVVDGACHDVTGSE